MTLKIISLLFNILFILIILWIGKDWWNRGKELDREKRMNDVLNESLEAERNRAAVLESEVGKLTRVNK